MNAIRVHEFGGPEVMKLESVPDPTPGPGQVLVGVRAAGVNPIDLYIRSGIYPVKPSLPTRRDRTRRATSKTSAPLGLVTPFQAFGADFVLRLPGCSRTDIPSSSTAVPRSSHASRRLA